MDTADTGGHSNVNAAASQPLPCCMAATPSQAFCSSPDLSQLAPNRETRHAVHMKIPFLALVVACMALFAPCGVGAEAPQAGAKVTLKLVGGDTITGTVGAVKDGAVSVGTEYGAIRVPVGKLSAESRTALGITDNADAESLRKRIAELEELVTRLREENAGLRKGVATASQPTTGGAASGVSQAPPAAEGMAYKLSSTGKRHNSRCRYFNSAGRACSATEGVACKVCGG